MAQVEAGDMVKEEWSFGSICNFFTSQKYIDNYFVRATLQLMNERWLSKETVVLRSWGSEAGKSSTTIK